MAVRNFIFYTHAYNENSGGSSLFYKICIDMNKKGYNNFYLAPIFCMGNGMIWASQENNTSDIDKHGRSQKYVRDLPDEYFKKSSYPEFMQDFIVTREMLEKRDNIAVYGEGFLGNPLEQRYVLRWIMYFPTPGLPVDPTNPFSKNDKFLFWDLAYFRNIDDSYTELNDCVTISKSDHYPDEKDLIFGCYPFLHEIIDLDSEKYKNIIREGSCHLIRKADPNYNRTFRQNWNVGKEYNKNHPYKKPKLPVYIHPENSILIDSYGLNDLINIFKTKEYFYCYDHYTFINCLALLYGCTVIMCPPENKKFSKEQWHCGNPIYLDYVAWGDSLREINKAREINKKVNYGEILKSYVKRKKEELFNSFIFISNNFKTELNELNINENHNFDGSNYKEINFSSEDYYPLYTSKYVLNEFIIELTFKIYPDNVEYANLFSFNYKSINHSPNQGPRLEYDCNKLTLIMGNKYSEMKGFQISTDIIKNKKYKLHVHYLCQNLTIKLSKLDETQNEELMETKNVYKVLFKPTNFKNLVLGKGFNEERYFKGEINNFNFKFL
tara:strand:- start:64 stop:1719 length:1656 start_codon:yes stop_codon:yes gene_type:complete